MPNEIIVEVDALNNASVLFHPLMKPLRGRWLDSRIPSGMGEGQSHVRDIKDVPGQRIALDVQSKKGRVFDPIGDPEYQQLRVEIRQKWMTGSSMQPVLQTPAEPIPEQEYNLTQEQVATWWYWMKRLCDEKQCRHVAGSWGKQPEGRIKVNFYDWNRQNPQYKDQFDEQNTQPPARSNANP